MFVIGITGRVCAGKGEFKQFLKEFDSYMDFSLSEVLRNELKNRGMNITRDNLILLGNLLRKEHGPGVLAKMLSKELKPPAIIESIRNPGEIHELRRIYGNKFVLVNIRADRKNRFGRMRSRGRENDPKSWDEFLKLEEIENGVLQGSFGQLLTECENMADVTIDNDDGLLTLRKMAKDFFDGLNK